MKSSYEGKAVLKVDLIRFFPVVRTFAARWMKGKDADKLAIG